MGSSVTSIVQNKCSFWKLFHEAVKSKIESSQVNTDDVDRPKPRPIECVRSRGNGSETSPYAKSQLPCRCLRIEYGEMMVR